MPIVSVTDVFLYLSLAKVVTTIFKEKAIKIGETNSETLLKNLFKSVFFVANSNKKNILNKIKTIRVLSIAARASMRLIASNPATRIRNCDLYIILLGSK